VEPAPEIVPEALLEDVELDELLLEELELLPQAASPSVSNATLASAPILCLITTSPLAGLRVFVLARSKRTSPSCSEQSLNRL
jgi:hypothetical protein